MRTFVAITLVALISLAGINALVSTHASGLDAPTCAQRFHSNATECTEEGGAMSYFNCINSVKDNGDRVFHSISSCTSTPRLRLVTLPMLMPVCSKFWDSDATESDYVIVRGCWFLYMHSNATSTAEFRSSKTLRHEPTFISIGWQAVENSTDMALVGYNFTENCALEAESCQRSCGEQKVKSFKCAAKRVINLPIDFVSPNRTLLKKSCQCNDQDSLASGLSVGAIVGIVVGSVAAVGMASFGGYRYVRYQRPGYQPL